MDNFNEQNVSNFKLQIILIVTYEKSFLTLRSLRYFRNLINFQHLSLGASRIDFYVYSVKKGSCSLGSSESINQFGRTDVFRLLLF